LSFLSATLRMFFLEEKNNRSGARQLLALGHFVMLL